MKRVTKKLVKEILAGFTGWNWSYDFVKDQKIILFSHHTHEAMVAALEAGGLEVEEYLPPKSPRTGHMKLRTLSGR